MARTPPPYPRLTARTAELANCTYCPSLCRHACPIATVEASDTVSPWGLMSLAEHVRHNRVALDAEVAEVWTACNGCGACSAACKYDNDVAGTLRDARAEAVLAGHAPPTLEALAQARPPLSVEALRERVPGAPYEARPKIALIPGRKTLDVAPEVVEGVFKLSRAFEVDTLGIGEAARLDCGYDLWFHGHLTAFEAQAARFHAALAGAHSVVVMSAEVLVCLREAYPAINLPIEAELMHVSQFVMPLITGAPVGRLDVEVALHDSCHMARRLGLVDTPREVLARIAAQPVVDLAACREQTWCCGATGALDATRPETSDALASSVIDLVRERGIDRVVSFSPECVAQLRRIAGDAIRVDHALELLVEALDA